MTFPRVDDLGKARDAATRALPGVVGNSHRVGATAVAGDADVSPMETESGGPHSFFDKSGLIVEYLGRVIATETPIRLGHDGRLYRYVSGVYRPDGDTHVRVRTRELLGRRCKRRHFDEALAWFRAHHPQIGERPPESLINCSNGLLDWRTGELRPHTPDVLSSVQIPVAWAPDARCPQITKFVGEVLPGDSTGLAYELVGYAMYAANPYRKAVLALGSGRNGKTVWLSMIRAFVGPENTSAVPLQVLAENRFVAAELYGRLANICGDLDARAIRRSDLFKQITGGDSVLAERKFAHPFTFTPFALPLFSANEPPISSDQTDAWFDRWIILPFDRRFSEDEADPQLVEKLTVPDELEGLLVLAVSALRRLMDRGRFDLPASANDAASRYRDRLDTVRAFLDEECTLDPDAWVARAVLYDAYKTWAKDGGRLPVTAATLNDHLRKLDHPPEEHGRKGIRGWTGIRLATARDHHDGLQR